MGKKPARKRGARRLNVTPELLANIRQRYEHSEERLATMAADLGCCGETVRHIAKREGWVRYEPPPRDLSPAARLRVRAEQLAEQPSPLIPAHSRPKDGVLRTPMRESRGHKLGVCGPGSPLSRGRAENEEPLAPTSEQTAALHAKIAGELLQEVAGHLVDVRAARKRMKREGYAKHELQAVSRVIADLSNSLNRLKPMAARAAEPDSGTPYDDMPADLDEFRDALARRIEALLASEPDAGAAAPAAAGGAAAAQA